jgi:lipoprotein-anchoring transpeptidase ErfK/SrfK
MPFVRVAIAIAIGFAVPAYGQPTPAPTNSGATAGQPAGVPEAQPGTSRSTTLPDAQGTTTPQTAPRASNPSQSVPATTSPPETAAATTPEREPVIAEGVRKAADGRLTFSGTKPAAVELPGGSKRSVKSVLNVTKPLSYGEYVWDEKDVPKGRIWILVDPARQLISVFRGKHEIGTAVTLYGADEFPTPAGHFRILARMKDHHSRTYNNAPMPYTLRLTNDGVAIHGNNVLEGYASHGCVGVPLEFARRLFSEARVGDEVFIKRYERAKPKTT